LFAEHQVNPNWQVRVNGKLVQILRRVMQASKANAAPATVIESNRSPCRDLRQSHCEQESEFSISREGATARKALDSARQPGDRPGAYVIGAAGVSLSVSLPDQFKPPQTFCNLLQCLRMRAACTGDRNVSKKIGFCFSILKLRPNGDIGG